MKRILVATLAALSLAACSKQPSVQEVADAAGQGSVALVKEANASMGSLTGSSTTTAMGQLIDRANHDGLLPSLQALPSPITSTFQKTALANVVAGTTSLPSGTDLDSKAQALGDFLRNRIFTKDNLESSGNGELVFRITGDDVCTDGTYPADPACVSSFDRFEVRIRVTRGVLGYEFYLELGPKKLEPFEAVIGQNLIGAGVDLAQVKASVEYVDSVTGDSTSLPKTMEGRVFATLQKNGDQDFTLTGSVKQAVKVEADTANGPASFSTEAKDPAFQLHVQGAQHALDADLDVGVTDASFPYKGTLSQTGNAGHEVTLHLAGASAHLSISEASLSADLTNVGLGDDQTTLALDGVNLLAVDLNPSSGRHFDLHLAYSAAAHNLQIQLSPELDLTTAFFYQPLQADTDVSIPPYAVNSTYHFLFDGDSPTLEPASTGYKVTSGTLRLENVAHPDQAVVVDTGRCLVSVTPAAGADPLLGGYAAQDCP